MYIVKKINLPLNDINSPIWEDANVVEINVANWDDFPCGPSTQARLLYSNEGLHIKLTTDEKPLLARCNNQNDMVCEDSCMEFFFRPNSADPHYINFEFNPFGTMYMSISLKRGESRFLCEDKAYFDVRSIITGGEWSVMFTVPFEFLDREFDGHTDEFYGNIYKCGGYTEHYLSLYPIKSEIPDFHRPECFGKFVLK